ncbi:MAG TPA: hypothetical protein VKW78_16635 [Terriglobales bacterium]|nr:hypothetical protein [Terriglobales bacterium]
MHWFDLATLFLVATLLGVEFSVSAFINPAAGRLEPEAQLRFLHHSASVGGRVMPIWYSACTVVLGIQTWLHWHTPGRALLLAVDAIWIIISLLSIFFLVPLNNRMIQGVPDWKRILRTWDKVHRVRIAAVALAAILLMHALVC